MKDLNGIQKKKKKKKCAPALKIVESSKSYCIKFFTS